MNKQFFNKEKMNIEREFRASENRYNSMLYNRCGNSGIILPAISLGLWHNFGHVDSYENSRDILCAAFDLGITHFDLANNYGPPYGSAEENFGRVLKKDFLPYRNELLISSKAGYDMWPGPYGNFGSRKYLVSSCDSSLKRLGLDYVDIFYHHRPDLETPIEETMKSLDFIVRSGRALYAGISNYPAELTKKAASILRELGTPCLIHQPRYNMFDRWVEDDGLLNLLENEQIGSIVFSPLAQGMLTDKYLHGIPKNSRAAKSNGALQEEQITKEKTEKIRKLNIIAQHRDQGMAQMAISWLLKDNRVTSVLIGASSKKQLENSVKSLDNLSFSKQELDSIDEILKGA